MQAFERYFLFLKYGYVVALVAHILFGLIFYSFGLYSLACFNLLSILIYCIALWILERGHQSASLLFITLEVSAHAYMAILYLGWGSGFHYYFFTLLMASAFNPYWKVVTKLSYAAVVTSGYIILGYYASTQLPFVMLDEMVIQVLHSFNVIFSLVFIGYLAHVYAKATSDAEEKLRQLASTDPLTGLYNRREFLQIFDLELVKNRRNQIPFSIIMMDIDNFKMINDTHGHQCGDEALIAVSECLRKNIREQDHIARWGGEEFMLLLPETDMEGAIVLAEKLHDAIRALEFSCESHVNKITVTLSVGEHEYHETRDQLILRVDSGLIRGKETGKNQIVCVK